MPHAELLAEEIAILRETIRANDGANVANWSFARKVDQLISDFYDDIGELTDLRLSDIIDLFLIKVLYVERKSRDATTLEYIGRMMERYLKASDLAVGPRRGFVPYLTDLMEETANPSRAQQNAFESYRKYGDNALFISGIFPQSLGRKRGVGRLGGAPFVDKSYFITMGRRYYEMAAGHELAEWVSLRETLLRLAHFFDVYVDALNEMSGRYVMGMDMRLIADKMLDAFNRYRETKDPSHLDTARKFAALLKLDARQWPALKELERAHPTYL
ncbi:MAG: hypothetical protein ACM3S1_06355 [Hyphomicrobiales bacterium]